MKANAKRALLPECEWAFHLVKPSEYDACAYYECQREAAGDSAQELPWLKLSKQQRTYRASFGSSLITRRTPVFLEPPKTKPPPSGIEDISEKLLNYAFKIDPTLTLRLPLPPLGRVVVDWRESDEQLIRAFTAMIKTERKTQGSSAHYYRQSARTKNLGSRPDVGRLLVDIALLRAKRWGLTRNQTLDRIWPLLKHFNLVGMDRAKVASFISSKGWPTTLAGARKHLRLGLKAP